MSRVCEINHKIASQASVAIFTLSIIDIVVINKMGTGGNSNGDLFRANVVFSFFLVFILPQIIECTLVSFKSVWTQNGININQSKSLQIAIWRWRTLWGMCWVSVLIHAFIVCMIVVLDWIYLNFVRINYSKNLFKFPVSVEEF